MILNAALEFQFFGLDAVCQCGDLVRAENDWWDLALAYVLCGLSAFEWVPAALLVGSVAAGGGYNYWLCSTIERLRK